MPAILVAGCGYVGSRLASSLVEDGDRVWGLRRGPTDLPVGVTAVRADVTDASTLGVLPKNLDALVFAVSPDSRDPAAYRAAFETGLQTLVRAVREGSPDLRRVVLVSSTGVFGQRDGRWVDEGTPPEPCDETGSILLEGERGLRALEPEAVVLRLGGIYGPGRTRTARRVVGGEVGCPPPDRYTNRIHRDDAAGAVRHLLRLASPEALYLGVDREPAPLRDVYAWIAERAGVPGPCAGSGTEVGAGESRRASNKRCRSDRLEASGYRFAYPTYREGYASIVDHLVGSGDHVGDGRVGGRSGRESA